MTPTESNVSPSTFSYTICWRNCPFADDAELLKAAKIQLSQVLHLAKDHPSWVASLTLRQEDGQVCVVLDMDSTSPWGTSAADALAHATVVDLRGGASS